LIILQDKKQYKQENRVSPDLADAAAMLQEVALQKGFELAAHGRTEFEVTRHQDLVADAQAAFAPTDYQPQSFADFDDGAFEPESPVESFV
jgi:hypothetical protein